MKNFDGQFVKINGKVYALMMLDFVSPESSILFETEIKTKVKKGSFAELNLDRAKFLMPI